jgi:hypothetical protein
MERAQSKNRIPHEKFDVQGVWKTLAARAVLRNVRVAELLRAILERVYDGTFESIETQVEKAVTDILVLKPQVGSVDLHASTVVLQISSTDGIEHLL